METKEDTADYFSPEVIEVSQKLRRQRALKFMLQVLDASTATIQEQIADKRKSINLCAPDTIKNAIRASCVDDVTKTVTEWFTQHGLRKPFKLNVNNDGMSIDIEH